MDHSEVDFVQALRWAPGQLSYSWGEGELPAANYLYTCCRLGIFIWKELKLRPSICICSEKLDERAYLKGRPHQRTLADMKQEQPVPNMTGDS